MREIAPSIALFKTAIPASGSDIPLFDVSADGRRFLVNTPLERQISAPLTLVVNWRADAGN